jgi:hypothetical protein
MDSNLKALNHGKFCAEVQETNCCFISEFTIFNSDIKNILVGTASYKVVIYRHIQHDCFSYNCKCNQYGT